jgi:hypothetical protein
MTDRIRTLSDDALKLHGEAFDFAMRQAELAREQANSAFGIGRASLEATRDLQASMARNVMHAFAPVKDAPKA